MPLKSIVVDLTPVLPSGQNGGAKVFVLELLSRLADLHPETDFVLFTQSASHEELALLDRVNMRRFMAVDSGRTNAIQSCLLSIASRLLPHLPTMLRKILVGWGYRCNKAIKRLGTGSMLRNLGADLLYCPFTAPTYFEPRVPMVCTIHDLQYKSYPEFFAAEDLANRNCSFLDACRCATALTAISDFSREATILYGHIDPACILTIYHRLAKQISPAFKNEHNELLDRIGLQPQYYLIYPANFWKHKNHEMLLAAFGIACHHGLSTAVKLVCTGTPGPRQKWLMRAARAMNLADRVLFPGYLTASEMDVLMANCTGLIFPSLYEGFGLPVIEAMAAGVPVACSNLTALPEIAADAALLFDPRIPAQIAQAILSLVADGKIRERLIQAGQKRVIEFQDRDRMAEAYWDVFQGALQSGRVH